ncbi:YkvA family protein [Kribbia dieselivorans]|uniref:YkvA family protein n=1 Tax=Kribbia dieselivorans TaxID=331526 RepID=UPI00083987A8|nr:DUF1232 domain-containing protein [Kribbia dieselivorans]
MATKTSRFRTARGLWAAFRAVTRPGSATASQRLAALPRLFRAVVSGRYTGTPVRTLGLMVLALVYIVSPVDVMPEGMFALLGLADDVLVLSWLASTLVNVTEDFLHWESVNGRRSVPGEPVTVRSTVVR